MKLKDLATEKYTYNTIHELRFIRSISRNQALLTQYYIAIKKRINWSDIDRDRILEYTKAMINKQYTFSTFSVFFDPLSTENHDPKE